MIDEGWIDSRKGRAFLYNRMLTDTCEGNGRVGKNQHFGSHHCKDCFGLESSVV